MAITINTNIESLNAQRNLYNTQNILNRSLERLSSGLRINSAKDDAAGLAISDRMNAQVRGLNQAVRNANDGISLAQTAEGALQESTSILQRIRELAVQSANDSNTSADRASIQTEVSQLQSELNRIADETKFNGKALFDGTFTAQKFQVGADSNQVISLSISNTRADHIGNNTVAADGTITEAVTPSSAAQANNFKAQALTISGNLGTATIASTTLTDGSTAKEIATEVNNVESQTGVTAKADTVAYLSGLSAAGTVSFNLYGSNTSGVAISATVSSTTDLSNLADEINAHAASTDITASVSGGKITLESTAGYDIKVEDFAIGTATSGSSDTIKFTGSGSGTTLTEGTTTGATDSSTVGGEVTFSSAESFQVNSTTGSTFVTDTTNNSTLSEVASIDVGTQSGANSALDVADAALARLDNIRGNLGAIQNRFGHTIANLQNVSQNISAARSRITDADFAIETANMTKAQILQQAGLAMLAQANKLPQAALTLLK